MQTNQLFQYFHGQHGPIKGENGLFDRLRCELKPGEYCLDLMSAIGGVDVDAAVWVCEGGQCLQNNLCNSVLSGRIDVSVIVSIPVHVAHGECFGSQRDGVGLSWDGLYHHRRHSVEEKGSHQWVGQEWALG